MKTTTLPLERLIPYAGNPRKNDHAVEQVAAAIKRFGFRVPVLAKSDGSLIDGHLRVKAAKHLGMDEVPVVLCDDLSEADIKALRISINRMAELAEWDSELLSIELEGLAAEGFTLEDIGFDADELKMEADELSITDGFSESSEQSTDLADVVFSFGQYRFPVERNVFLQWQENIRQAVGFADLEVQGEIKKRMKL